MFTHSKRSAAGLTLAASLALSACASQVPRIGNASLGYAVTNFEIAADSNEQALSGALGSAMTGLGLATAMPAHAEVTIEAVRYNSPFIGFFYGGQHYASLSVVLSDGSGSRIGSFPVYVAANGSSASADGDLAREAAQIIAAKAANAYMPLRKTSRAKAPVIAVEAAAVPVVDVAAPIEDAVAPATDDAAPCVIGPDGKCLVL